MTELTEGTQAPEFTLPDKDGKPHSLSQVNADYTVVYFYPKDDTPGCTVEATEFTRELPNFRKADTEVIGISGGTEATKKKFCAKHQLGVTLLSDTDFAVAKSYGAYGPKKFMGKTYEGVLRKTFVLDSTKRILKIYPSVKAEGHAAEVLEYIKTVFA